MRWLVDQLSAGEVGYVVTGLKDLKLFVLGDALTWRQIHAQTPVTARQTDGIYRIFSL